MNMLKRIPAWVVGGLIGVLYFIVTFSFDFLSTGPNEPEAFGLFTAFTNLPGTILFSLPIIPSFLQTSTPFQLTIIVVTNFIIGALIGWCVSRIFRKRRTS